MPSRFPNFADQTPLREDAELQARRNNGRTRRKRISLRIWVVFNLVFTVDCLKKRIPYREDILFHSNYQAGQFLNRPVKMIGLF